MTKTSKPFTAFRYINIYSWASWPETQHPHKVADYKVNWKYMYAIMCKLDVNSITVNGYKENIKYLTSNSLVTQTSTSTMDLNLIAQHTYGVQ